MPIQSSVSGQILQGTYLVERVVGEGGFGTVYEASHLRLGRKFAVKIISRETKIEPEQLKRFWREAEVMGRLGHQHIVEIIDVNQTEDGTPYIIMELLSGESLAQRLARVGRLGLGEASAVLEQVGSALDAAHAKGIVHRDLKPENVFLCNSEAGAVHVKVIDFGISKLLSAPSLITGEHRLLGTPHYMSPEQVGGSDVGPAADIFSLGVVAYQMVSGRRPFEGDSALKVVLAVCHNEPPQLSEVCPGLPAPLEGVIRKALSKSPGERHATAHELAEAFAQAIWPSLDTDLGSLHESQLRTRPFEPAPSALQPALGETLPPDPKAAPPAGKAGSTEIVSRAAGGTGRRVGPLLVVAAVAVATVTFLIWRAQRRADPPVAASPAAAVELDATSPAATAPLDRGVLVREAPPPPVDAAPAPPKTVRKVMPRPKRETRPPPVAETGSLRLAASRGGQPVLRASVYLDGKLVGITPVQLLSVPVGAHRVEVADAHSRSSQKIRLSAGQAVRLVIELPP